MASSKAARGGAARPSLAVRRALAANGQPGQRVKRPESRRQEFLDAALIVLTAKGVQATTVAEITEQAGAAKGTFYRYFQTKDELVLALQEQFAGEVAEGMRIGAREATAEGWEAQVRAALSASYDFYVANAEAHHMLFHSHVEPPSEDNAAAHLRAVLEPVAVMEDLIRQAVAAGQSDCPDPAYTAFLIFGAIHAAFDRELESGEFGRQELLERCVDFWIRASQPHTSTRGSRRLLRARRS